MWWFPLLSSFSKLPLTANGKVDRNALPTPESGWIRAERIFVPPSNRVEEFIAEVWRELLGVKEASVHDNFFELGGHSLKATRLVSRLRAGFRNEMPLRHIFEYPTIAELAKVIVAEGASGTVDINRLLTEIEAMSKEAAQPLI